MNQITHPLCLCVLVGLASAIVASGNPWYVISASPTVFPIQVSAIDSGIVLWQTPTTAQSNNPETFDGVAAGASDEIYVAGNTLGRGTIGRFSASTGQSLGVVVDFPWSPGLPPDTYTVPSGLALGPDGALYAPSYTFGLSASGFNAQIFRFDPNSGEPIGTQPLVSPGSGGLGDISDLDFGCDRNLYVSDSTLGVLRYNRQTGAFLNIFVPVGLGGLHNPASLAFRSDGHLFVADRFNSSVLEYDASGGFLGVFLPEDPDGLLQPRDIDFGDDGNLYVASGGLNNILIFDGMNGSPLGQLLPDGSDAFGEFGPFFMDSYVADRFANCPETAAPGGVFLGLLGWSVTRRRRSRAI